MSIRQFLAQNQYIQIGINVEAWEDLIAIAAAPLIKGGFVTAEYPQAVIDNTRKYGAYYVFEEGIAIPHARPECGVIKNGFSLLTLARPVSISDSEPVDIIVMFSGMDSDTHITQGIASIVELLDKAETLAQIRQATTVDEIIRLL
ncbi:PTS system ascorbate-specific IIA component [Erwinia persicina]|uniref:PTS sugar transporter subunit IIA n=1 Tax=Erwinia TaxID=551 RepID=UPI00209D085C|nr:MULTISPECIES: PTS sugar transporter subunit IIA [Erwinia]MCP1437396.1 PTS system ascorbate-specific IIA component [Erwinia persicina]MDN4626311.1 PTS sugar transporter subunit IIA [Erwinia sp. PsM31]MDN8540766.1 PTS sugar transporter subunit IIA [Erwinia sp. BC051422]